MSTVHPDKNMARVEGAQEDIFYGSTLGVLGVLVEVIRARFRGANVNIPWFWDADPTPGDEETNEPSAPRKLYIESAYLEFPDGRNVRPAILVDAAEVVPFKDSVGNFAGADLPVQLMGYYSRNRITMEVLVIAETRGECMVLADHVRAHLLATRQLVRRFFQIHELTEPVQGRTQPYRRDKDIWETQLNFYVEIEMRWLTAPIAPLLQEIKMRLTQAGNGSVGVGAINIGLYGGNGEPR